MSKLTALRPYLTWCCRFAPGEPFEQPFETGHAFAKIREFLADAAYVAAQIADVPVRSVLRPDDDRGQRDRSSDNGPQMVKVSGVVARAPW